MEPLLTIYAGYSLGISGINTVPKKDKLGFYIQEALGQLEYEDDVLGQEAC